jgi:hypothetical protein
MDCGWDVEELATETVAASTSGSCRLGSGMVMEDIDST